MSSVAEAYAPLAPPTSSVQHPRHSSTSWSAAPTYSPSCGSQQQCTREHSLAQISRLSRLEHIRRGLGRALIYASRCRTLSQEGQSSDGANPRAWHAASSRSSARTVLASNSNIDPPRATPMAAHPRQAHWWLIRDQRGPTENKQEGMISNLWCRCRTCRVAYMKITPRAICLIEPT